MGSLLGSVIKENLVSRESTFDNVEALRKMTKDFRNDDASHVSESSFADVVGHVRSLSDHQLLRTSRAFGQFLAIANAAETHQRIRSIRKPEFLESKANSIEGALKSLLASGVSKTAYTSMPTAPSL